MEGRCPECNRAYDISDEFLAMGGKAKCPHCLLELVFESQPQSKENDEVRFYETTKPDPTRMAPAGEGSAGELDARCTSCGRYYKVDRSFLQTGGSAKCPHCSIDLVFDTQVPPADAQAEGEEPPPAPDEDVPAGHPREEEYPAGDEQQAVGEGAEDPWSVDTEIHLPELKQLQGDRAAQDAGPGAATDDDAGQAEAGDWETPDESEQDEDGLTFDDELEIENSADFEANLDLSLEDQEKTVDLGASGLSTSDRAEEEPPAQEDFGPPSAGGGEAFDDQQSAAMPMDEGDTELAEQWETPSEDRGDVEYPRAGDELDEEGDTFVGSAAATAAEDIDADPGAEPDLENVVMGQIVAEEEYPPAESGQQTDLDEEGAEGEELFTSSPETSEGAQELVFDEDGMEKKGAEEEEGLPDAGEEPGTEQLDAQDASPETEWDQEISEDEQPWPTDGSEDQVPVEAGESLAKEDAEVPAGQPETDAAGQEDDSGMFAGLAGSEDWAAAAARWAESGFQSDEIPSFIQGEEGPRPAESEAEQERAEGDLTDSEPAGDTTGEPEGGGEVLVGQLDESAVEVSDADIMMLDDDEVESLDEEEAEPSGEKAETWAQKASREIKKTKKAEAGRQVRKESRLSRFMSAPILVGAVGLLFLLAVGLIWVLLSGDGDIEGIEFPVEGLDVEVIDAPEPSAYEAKQDAMEHYGLGNRLAHLGKFEDAILEYKQASRLDPGYPHPYRALGAIYAALGKQALSQNAYQTYLRLAPHAADKAQVAKIISGNGGE